MCPSRELNRLIREAFHRIREAPSGSDRPHLQTNGLTSRAHEDEAERSVRAALDIVDVMAELNAAIRRPPGVELAVRIGIATGPVIICSDAKSEGTGSQPGEAPQGEWDRGRRHLR